eukprot:COSAG04_NODE_64_length_29689_cov_158.096992_22_plen_61_part_00
MRRTAPLLKHAAVLIVRYVLVRYVNGQELGSTGEWATHSYHFDAPCGDGNVYAIHGKLFG